jgi:hypothetical protein
MITEDYVSFETAKLLKEKGFTSVWCTKYYEIPSSPNNKFHPLRNSALPKDYNFGDLYCSATTLQMAMKWLRENYSIHIMVNCIGSERYEPTIQTFSGKDYEIEGEVVWVDGIKRGFKTCEQAIEAAIKYCLENLI